MDDRFQKYFVPVASKTLDVLEAFRAPQDELTLDEIVERTAMSHTTAFRILFTLVHRNYVARRGNRYRLNQARRKFRIGLGVALELPFAHAVMESLKRSTVQGGGELIVFDNSLDPQTAIQSARRMVDARVDIGIEFQRYHEIAPQIGDLFASAGIPLIAIHVPHPGATYFGPDNYRAGLVAGEALAEHARKVFIRQSNLFILLGIEEAGNFLHARISGVFDGLARVLGSLPSEQIVCVNGSGDRAQSKRIVLSTLRNRPANGGILIAGASDHSALGALDAVESLGIAKRCAIIGHDGDQEAIKKIADPKSPFIGTIGFFPERYGPGLMKLSLRLINGDHVPPFEYVTYELIDKKKSIEILGGKS